jgi:hypothetical protein
MALQIHDEWRDYSTVSAPPTLHLALFSDEKRASGEVSPKEQVCISYIQKAAAGHGNSTIAAE